MNRTRSSGPKAPRHPPWWTKSLFPREEAEFRVSLRDDGGILWPLERDHSLSSCVGVVITPRQ
jgi:hypothetical protein